MEPTAAGAKCHLQALCSRCADGRRIHKDDAQEPEKCVSFSLSVSLERHKETVIAPLHHRRLFSGSWISERTAAVSFEATSVHASAI